MARIRQYKPSFSLDEDVANLSPWARLLFIGLWPLADRKGRLEDRPAWIRVQVFPYDDLERQGISVHALLDELAATRKNRPGSFITRYVVGDKAFIQVNAFERHQKPHPNEPASTIPGPPKEVPKPQPVTEDSRKATAPSTNGVSAATIGSTSSADSGERILVPSESLLPPYPPQAGGAAAVEVPTNGNGHRPKGRQYGLATLREKQRLETDPEVVRVADTWAKEWNRPSRELGVLRAAATALAGGYTVDACELVIRTMGIAVREPERFQERGSFRWALGAKKARDPSYMLRTSTLDRLISEAEEWHRE